MKVLKYIFYTYVILLAGYVTYKTVMGIRLGQQRVAFTQAKRQCYQGGDDWRYCVSDAEKARTNTYLYVFHGKGEDEKMWSNPANYSALLQDYWQWNDSKVPRVITISFGPAWLVTSQMSKLHTGLLERFRTEVFPSIEQALGKPKKRFLLGDSMGGLNVLTIALGMPKNFSRVAALCPPIYTLSPFAGVAKILKFAINSGVKPKALLIFLGLGRYYFSNEEEWLKFSPLEKIKTVQFKPHQKFYISAGLRDRYGLYAGARKFTDRLKRSGARAYWRPNSGDHCSVDVESLGDFLSP